MKLKYTLEKKKRARHIQTTFVIKLLGAVRYDHKADKEYEKNKNKKKQRANTHHEKMYTTLPYLDICIGDKVYDCSNTGYWLCTLHLAAKMKRHPSEKDELLHNTMQQRMKLEYIGIVSDYHG